MGGKLELALPLIWLVWIGSPGAAEEGLAGRWKLREDCKDASGPSKLSTCQF